jgi:hypothetical protein
MGDVTRRLIVPGLSDDDQGVLDENLARLRRCRDSNLLRSSLYEGKHAARQVGGASLSGGAVHVVGR